MKHVIRTALIVGSLALTPLVAGAHGPMMDQGGSYGPGMMGGSYGPGMMGGGYGPGMMGGGYGPDMMGGGYGPGMMGGGYGPGMMGSYGGAELSQEQRQRMSQIQIELFKQQQPLGQQLHQRTLELQSLANQPDADPKAVGDKYAEVFKLRQQMAKNAQQAHQQLQQSLEKKG